MKCMTSGSLSRSTRLSTSSSVNRRSTNRSVSKKMCIAQGCHMGRQGVAPWRDADVTFELAGEVGLIVEADAGGDAPGHDVLVRRDPERAHEASDQVRR